MHGRQKVEQSPEDQIKKDKERVKKLRAYRGAMSTIFEKRSKNELDAELLNITGQVLNSNPDIGTVWNIRREVLLFMKNAKSDSDAPENDQEFNDQVTKDLALTETCLLSNPKSYGAWHHRAWLQIQTGFQRVSEELKVVGKYLKYDERNFHCWDYRRFLLENSSCMTLEDELKFTQEKIESNFSNYSSWHLRSTLLPRLDKDYLLEELDLIKNAAFTDPNDQSVWLYHRWLLVPKISKDGDDDGPNSEIKPKTDAFEKILRGELEWVTELDEIEPENKWITSTLILLMRLIDFDGYQFQIKGSIEKLIGLDPKRVNYYHHLRSKYEKEWRRGTKDNDSNHNTNEVEMVNV